MTSNAKQVVRTAMAAIDLSLASIPAVFGGALLALGSGSYLWWHDVTEGFVLDSVEDILWTVHVVILYLIASLVVSMFRRAWIVRLFRRGLRRDRVLAVLRAARLRLVALAAVPVLLGVLSAHALVIWIGLYLTGSSARYAQDTAWFDRRRTQVIVALNAALGFGWISVIAAPDGPWGMLPSILSV